MLEPITPSNNIKHYKVNLERFFMMFYYFLQHFLRLWSQSGHKILDRNSKLKGERMKKLIFLFAVILLFGCASRQLSPEGYKITSVNDTSKCQFIQNGYTEVAIAANLTYYIQLNTERAGGDSYKIINTSQEKVSGMNIFEANFEIWKCKESGRSK